MRYLLTILLFFSLSCSNQNQEKNRSIQLKNEQGKDSLNITENEEAFMCIEEEPLFISYEVIPQFDNGRAGLKKFFKDHLVYPQSAIDDSIQGRVMLSFVIEADGRVSNISVMRGVRYDLDNECIRVACFMPRWVPGTQRGIPVRVRFSCNITFSLKEISEERFVNVYPNQKIEEKFELEIYPNPAKEFIYIKTSEDYPDKEYQIVSMNGNIVISGKLYSNKEQVDVSTLNKGLYLVKITSKKQKRSETEKLVIQ